ncbi:peptidoglycan DD-metalloendopeptidase family protein [Streptomyces sp. NPDC127033]|uniref:peptidoglycan DD-metalloendopeptidase family protein n=1 Tax=Streptomyces sp. NPDC127033 TaxID=3347110 RepID=UPI003651BEEA
MATIEFDHVKYGKTDACVKSFQKALIAKGGKIPSGPTGLYGPETKAACTKFQKAQGWTGTNADGLPGPQTFALLGLKDGGHKTGSSSSRVASPVPGYGTNAGNPYGKPGSYQAGFHTGSDYPAPKGTKVVAVRAGTIAVSNNNGDSYGTWIHLNADNGRTYVYCHLSKRSVSVGDKVKAGEKLGEVGSTGNSTGPHLHLEDRPRGGGYGNVRKPSW